MDQRTKIILFWVVLPGVSALMVAVVRNQPKPARATYSQFLSQVESGEVLKATISSTQAGANPVEYSLKNGGRLESVLPADYRDALNAMQQKLVNVEIESGPQSVRVVTNASPFLILLAFWFFMMFRLKHHDAK